MFADRVGFGDSEFLFIFSDSLKSFGLALEDIANRQWLGVIPSPIYFPNNLSKEQQFVLDRKVRYKLYEGT